MMTSLRARMRLLIVLLLALLGLGSLASFVFVANGEVKKNVTENAADTSRMVDRMLSLKTDYTLQRVVTLANQPTLKVSFHELNSDPNVGSDISYRTVKDNFVRFVGDAQVESLALMEDTGKIVAASPKWPRSMPSLLSRPGVKDVFSGSTWTGVEADGGMLRLIVISPVQLSSQGFYGALIGLEPITDEDARTLRFSDTSDVVFFLDNQPLAGSRKFTGDFINNPSAIQYANSGGQVYVGAYQQLHNTKSGQQLGFIAFENLDVLTSFGRRAGLAFMLILGLITVIGLGLGERFTRGFVTPLEQVAEAAKKMREGLSPPPFNVGSRKDEVAELQTVFNDMVAAVEDNQKLLLGMIDLDPLTGLANHRSFQERLRQEVHRAKEGGVPLSLLLLDLDNFHEYNAVRGHSEGDRQLKAYAGVIRAACPGAALLARYSGDQFVAILPGHGSAEAQRVADDIRRASSHDSELSPMCIGIAMLDPTAPNEEAITLSAELALSRAKQLGKNRTSLFESDMELEGSTQLIHKYIVEGSLDTVQALAAAVDAKDQYTQGHSERVAILARDLAEYMKNTPAFVELVYRSGTLHDVGKIGVPDAILSKPARLTPEETLVMETHPVLGEVIVAKVPSLAGLLPGVRSHHERWDGNGYPDRLAGEQIPIMARYLAVADTFDAMTSDRPYRKALAPEIALAEIEKCAGSQFQAELARGFVMMMRERRALKVSA